MKRLLVATAVLEAGSGVAFLIWPSAITAGLFGPKVPFVPALAPLVGLTLLAIAAVSGLASRHPESRAARGVVWGMTLYNLGAAGGLCVPKLASSQGGAFLWPAVALHAAMGVWCIICLRRARRPEGSTAPEP